MATSSLRKVSTADAATYKRHNFFNDSRPFARLSKYTNQVDSDDHAVHSLEPISLTSDYEDDRIVVSRR